MTAKIEFETSFMSLTPAEQLDYETIRTQIGAVLAQPNGLELVLNALIAQGPETTITEIGLWVSGVQDIDPRDLAAHCYGPERLITVESTIVDA